MDGFSQARRMMVDGQIRTNDVTDRRILAAFESVPRERFLPPELSSLAYIDRDLPVTAAGPGSPSRFLLKPMVLARLVQAAEIKPGDCVLDVGCATGYASAILADLGADVVALEEDDALLRHAEANLASLGAAGVTLRAGTLTEGVPQAAPYDAILIDGAVELLPEALGRQLKEGGRLVCVQREGPVCRGMLYRSGGDLSGRSLFDAGAHVLPGFARPAAFVF